MTATDPTVHAEGHLDGPQHAEPTAPDTTPDNYLDYAAQQYDRLAAQPPPMPMDVWIAATIGVGDEMRASTATAGRLTIGVDRLADAIERLEPLIADHTATMKAFLAAQQQGDRFELERQEAAIEQLASPEPS